MALTPFDLAPDPQFAAASQQASNLAMRPAYEQGMDQVAQGSRFNTAIGGAQAALSRRVQQPFLYQGAHAGQALGQQVASQTLQGVRSNEAMRLAAEAAERKRRQDMADTMLSFSQGNQDRAVMRSLADQKSMYNLVGGAIQLGTQAAGGIYENMRRLPPPPQMDAYDTLGEAPSF